jgi:ubiquinone/menaquinone biosynthesis C-methylase UbiE
MMSKPAALTLLDLIQSHRITAVIYVAARLGIADRLAGGPKSLDDLAEATGANRSALARLLTALRTIGICEPDGAEQYTLTETGAALAGDAGLSFKGLSFKAWAIMEGEWLSKSWSDMLSTIMSGKTAAELQGFDNSFDLMARVPENVGIFNAAMTDMTRLVTADVLAACDFSRVSHLLDVGGGSGELIGAILARYPQMRGTVIDLARCAELATAHFARLGLADRAAFLTGDFFGSVPDIADAIILKSVIHDWDDQRSCVILQNCRRALPENGKLLLVERIMPAIPDASDLHRSHAMSDLNMLRGPGGMERTEAQYRDLLGKTGFHVTSITAAGRFSVIEARPQPAD